MEGENNKFLVGFFVLVLLAGLAIFLIWMGQFGSKNDYTEYVIYTNESVAGMQKDSSVKYMGVDIGQVTDMQINPNNNEEVQINVKIKNGTPISVDTRAELKVFGITGLTYIELSGGSKQSPPLKPNANGLLVIKSTKSQIKNIADNINSSLEGLNKILTDKNSKNVELILENLAITTNGLKKFGDEMDALTTQIGDTLDITKTEFKKVGNAGDAVKQSAQKLDVVTKQTQLLINSGSQTMATLNTQTLPKINRLIDEMNATAKTYNDLGKQIQKDPSSLIW